MPQYVGLAQQGFFEPYQLLGDSLRHYQDRKVQQGQFNRQMSLSEKQQQDLLKQRDFENTLANKNFDVAAPIKQVEAQQGQFNLAQSKLQRDQALGLTNFNLHNMGTRGGASSVPDMLRQPAVNVQMNSPFEAQPPQVQKNVLDYATAHNISPAQAVNAFRQQQATETNRPFLPQLPGQPTQWEYNPEKGYTVKGFSPASGGGGQGQAPPGYTWAQNPMDGTMTLHKRDTPSGDNLQRLQSLDTLESQLNLAKENMNKSPGWQWAPGIAAISRAKASISNPEAYAAQKAFESNATALVPDIWRGINGFNTRLPEEEAKTIQKTMVPSLSDLPYVRQNKFNQLDTMLMHARINALQAMQNSGMDVSGFQPQAPQGSSPSAAPKQKFPSLSAAQQARLAPGTVVEVYDPATQKYRPWTP